MSSKHHNNIPVDTTVRIPISNLPGIPDGQVIASSPNIIRENSSVSLRMKKKGRESRRNKTNFQS